MNALPYFKKCNYLDIRIIHIPPILGATQLINDPLFISCNTKILYFSEYLLLS